MFAKASCATRCTQGLRNTRGTMLPFGHRPQHLRNRRGSGGLFKIVCAGDATHLLSPSLLCRKNAYVGNMLLRDMMSSGFDRRVVAATDGHVRQNGLHFER